MVCTKRQNRRRSVRCSRVSVDSISASSGPGGKRRGKSNSIRSTGLCLLIDFPMPGVLTMSANVAGRTSRKSTASRRGSRARTSATPAACVKRGSKGWPDRSRDCSSRSHVYSEKYNPLGWCLKTSRRCSIPTIAATCNKSSSPLPTAGIWDSGECLMLSISESPRNVVGFSWSRVLDATPHWSCWVTPRQWKQYLARLLRNRSTMQRADGLALLARPAMRHRGSVSVMKFSSLKRTHGIRWLSGRESLAYMGFPKGWMRAISRGGLRRVMRSSRRSLNGLL